MVKFEKFDISKANTSIQLIASHILRILNVVVLVFMFVFQNLDRYLGFYISTSIFNYVVGICVFYVSPQGNTH